MLFEYIKEQGIIFRGGGGGGGGEFTKKKKNIR